MYDDTNLKFLSYEKRNFNKFLAISEINLSFLKCPNTYERQRISKPGGT